MLLKPVSLAFAAASLIGIAGFVPAQAQTAYPGTTAPAYTGYTQSNYPAETTNPGYPGAANGGYGLPYPGPQAATPNTQSTYPSAVPGYGGNPAVAPQAETGYPPPTVPPQPGSYPGVANGGNGLPYPGPQAGTPNTQSTYPSARTDYSGGNSSAEPQAATGYQPQERTQMVTNGPQANVENESPGWSARQNVINSHRYDRLIANDQAFRNARMRKECGPITDPQLHASCIASFENRG